MKAEDEEKAKRRRQYLERSEEAAEKRRQIEEINMQKSKKDAAFDDNISAVNVLSEVDRAPAILGQCRGIRHRQSEAWPHSQPGCDVQLRGLDCRINLIRFHAIPGVRQARFVH